MTIIIFFKVGFFNGLLARDRSVHSDLGVPDDYLSGPSIEMLESRVLLSGNPHGGNGPPAHAQGPSDNAAVERSIEEFVDAQGTFSPFGDPQTPFGQVEPLADFVGWTDPANFLGISVDYGGIAASYLATEGIDLGTSFAGTVTEKPNADGTADVHVILHTRDALTWVIQGNPDTGFDFGTDPVVFGSRALDIVENGAQPSLGDSRLDLKLVSPQFGDPLPDLYEVFFGNNGWGVKQVKFQASATGLLADGTPGRANTSEAGVFNSGNFPNGHDGFPVEKVRISSIGNIGNSHGPAPIAELLQDDSDDNLDHLWDAPDWQ